MVLSRSALIRTRINHTVLTVYALIQSKKGWTLPFHPSEVDISDMSCHTVSGVISGEVRRGCMSLSGVIDTIGTKMLFSVCVFSVMERGGVAIGIALGVHKLTVLVGKIEVPASP